MKHTTITKILLPCIFFILSVKANSQHIVLKTDDTEVVLSSGGYYESVKVCGKEILQSKQYPFIIGGSQKELVMPESARIQKGDIHINMKDGGKVVLKTKETNTCVVFEVAEIPSRYDALIFGPLGVTIDDAVGDIIGVAQGNDVAFGFQALTIKTNAGIPPEYSEQIKRQFDYEGEQAQLSVGSIPDYRLAATRTAKGTIFQFSCCNRTKIEYRKVQQINESLVLPVEGEDALIKGAQLAMFGSKRVDALERIGKIEVERGLPHPMYDGEWGKTARSTMRSYLISNFSEDELDWILDKAEIAGFKYIYHSGPFLDWGHFDWDPKFTKSGDEGVKKMVEKSKARGVGMGIHTLSNFLTTNDPYVTPVPSKHLLKQGILEMQEDIDAVQTEIRIKQSDLFAMPMTLNALHVDDELITYGNAETKGDEMLLTGCTRGAFGTKASAHAAKSELFKLWDYPYKTLFPDIVLQDKFADRLSEIFNKTGLEMISFDGLEGCMYTGQDDYATARFVSRFYNALKKDILNDASNLNHYMWHIHSRMNWGEPWGEAMRTGQVENRIKNQDFFRRNLFPRMLGWFLIRLSEKNFECSTLEDLEWALSESAGFDAGYAMSINTRTLRRHGQIDQLLSTIREWDRLREKNVFTEDQKQRLKDPSTEWHLEKKDENKYDLYPLFISKPYRCNLAEMQPGQPGGSDWAWTTPYESRYKIRLKVEGDGTIKDPSFTTPEGVIKFPCEISDGQYLLLSFDGKAQVTDKNYNVLKEVIPQGKAFLPKGSSAVSFSCLLTSEDAPEVVVRYITQGEPERIVVE